MAASTSSSAPSASSVLDAIRKSCEQLVASSKCAALVRIDEDAVAALWERDFASEKDRSAHWELMPIPVNFETLDAEIDFYVLKNLISFGSAWSRDLDEVCRRGPKNSTLFGLLSLCISGATLDADTLARFSINDVEQHFQIPFRVEAPMEEHTAIKTLVDSRVRRFADRLLYTLETCGAKLRARQCRDFAQLLREAAARATRQGAAIPEVLVEELVRAFGNVADDSVDVGGVKLQLQRKAQLAVLDVAANVGGRDACFRLEPAELARFTAPADDKLVAVLLRVGVLQLVDGDLRAAIEAGESLQAGGLAECSLRAAALVAVERLAGRAGGAVPPAVLARRLVKKLYPKGEEGVVRPVCRDTLHY